MDNAALLSQLKTQARCQKYLQNGICECCGETNPLCLKIYEEHHLSTRAYSGETATLCLNCHAVITQTQNSLAPKHRKGQLPLNQRIEFIRLSHRALRKRMIEIEERLMRTKLEVEP